MNHHLKRWLTGIVAVPLLFALILFGSENLFSFFIFVVILLALWEYNCLVFGKDSCITEKIEVMAFAYIIVLSMYLNDFPLIVSAITFSILISFLLFILRIKGEDFDTLNLGKVLIGFMYIPLMMSYFILLRRLTEGVLWIFFLLVIAFSGDIFAYYTGKTIGRQKLQPFISPGKTIEGTIALFVGSIAGALFFQHFFFKEVALIHAFIIGTIGGMLGQLGDLFESAIKREAGVKDSGSILPGHGGIMDRIDCLCFMAPFVYYYQLFVIR
jgi:phosphatidate cytidylyltransferase